MNEALRMGQSMRTLALNLNAHQTTVKKISNQMCRCETTSFTGYYIACSKG